jgi:hypothetical protein
MASKQQDAITTGATSSHQNVPDAASSSTNTAAQTAVLTTVELLENIISNLRAPDILLATAVCKTWQTTIEGSPKLREQVKATRYDDTGSMGEMLFFDITYDTFIIRHFEKLQIVYALRTQGQRNTMKLVDGKNRSLEFAFMSDPEDIRVKFEDVDDGYHTSGTVRFMHKPTRDYVSMNLMGDVGRTVYRNLLRQEKERADENMRAFQKMAELGERAGHHTGKSGGIVRMSVVLDGSDGY